MDSFDFATVGDNCIDRFLPPISLSLIGGNAVNVGVQLSRLGLRTGYFGVVGHDEDGRRMLTCFRDNGLYTDHVRVLSGTTAYTNIEVDEAGDRTLAFEEFGVCRGYRPSATDMQTLLRMRHVHIGWLDDGGATRRALSAAGVSVSQDISVNAEPANLGIEGLTIAFASAGEDMSRAKDLLHFLHAGGAKTAVVTCGSLGSIASDGTGVESVGVRTLDAVDTTGAGDSFIAGFISEYVFGKDLQTCLAKGRDVAAETCRHVGGFPQQAQSLE
ncbi:PfkB family carbohydrate kinase [Microvirga roseola]|uniref:PfkB family carbohydrate kinase n=1 Tax=Microvirga roseola TaxID=2883126 RepID=UPI001E6593D6|nr:PfkB family carbohydrate kinase [Microvirga roseola]